MIRELKSTGATVEENDLICHLLLTMPAEYNTVVTAIETLSMKELSISFVKIRLCDEETKRNSNSKKLKNSSNGCNAFYTKGEKNEKEKSGSVPGKNSKHKDCSHFCGKKGHIKPNCLELKKRNAAKETKTATSDSKNPTSSACLTNTSNETVVPAHSFIAACDVNKGLDKCHWYLDSGSTEHLVRENENVSNIQSLPTPITIRVTKTNNKMTAKNYGEIKGFTDLKGSNSELLIKPVLIVPGLQHNLLSVSKLDKNGFQILFGNSACS